jgi:sugar phosphate isomerase/epimerase
VEGHNRGALSLLELPDRLAEFGIHTLEICHFHLPSRDPGYLAELRAALAAAGVELFSLLIDAGDVTDPQHGRRDAAWIAGWFAVGQALGTKCARVIAGKQPASAENLAVSQAYLADLASQAEAAGIRLMTENWFSLLSSPAAVIRLLDGLAGRVGFCLDFGNWKGEQKYADFARIAPYAESCHSKAYFDEAGRLDQADYTRCLDITAAANFSGPYTLIYESPALADWAGLAAEKAVVEPYLS